MKYYRIISIIVEKYSYVYINVIYNIKTEIQSYFTSIYNNLSFIIVSYQIPYIPSIDRLGIYVTLYEIVEWPLGKFI